MSKRFKYDSMTGQQLRTALDGLDMPYMEFCRLTGANERTVKKWLDGEQDIPTWVSMALYIFKNQPDAVLEAGKWAAKSINSDMEQAGIKYPYRSAH
jgi:hypothetical protein